MRWGRQQRGYSAPPAARVEAASQKVVAKSGSETSQPDRESGETGAS